METGFNTREIIQEFEKLTMDAGKTQREILHKILYNNAKSEYLSKCGLSGRIDPESFKACVPLVTSKDIQPYIERIMNGDDSPILTTKPTTAIVWSSGTTTGKRKYIPFNEEMIGISMQVSCTSYAFRDREFPVEKNGKDLGLLFLGKQYKSKGGLPIGPISSHIIPALISLKPLLLQLCSPPEVFMFAPDFHQSLYCHFLSGLLFRDQVQTVTSTFALNLVFSFKTFENIWKELCDDIRKGVVSSKITTPSVQTAMSKLLKPDPELANLISEKCEGLERNGWFGMIPELFPNTKYIDAIMTGTMLPYVKKLRHYAGDRIPLVSVNYAASEGWVGLNGNPSSPPESAAYAVIPNIGYYEFIPLRKDVAPQVEKGDGTGSFREPEPVGLTEVEIGEEYEVVVTTPAGLYRNRLGDVVKVEGFHNTTPELQFVCRRDLLLQIHVDKNTEKDLQFVVEQASQVLAKHKLEIIDFTSRAEMSTDPPCFVIFWELSGDVTTDHRLVLQECCDALDNGFVGQGYAVSRRCGTIGPLELIIIGAGTFQKILEHYVEGGTSFGQFKTPRCVRPTNEGMLRILSSNVVKSYFSSGYN